VEAAGDVGGGSRVEKAWPAGRALAPLAEAGSEDADGVGWAKRFSRPQYSA